MPTISSTTTLTLAAGQAYVFLPGSGVGTAIADPDGRNAKFSIGPQQTAIGPFSTSVSVDVLITSGSIEYRVDTDGDLRDQDPAIAAQAAAIAAVEANAAFVTRNAAGAVTGLVTAGGENPLEKPIGVTVSTADELTAAIAYIPPGSTIIVLNDITVTPASGETAFVLSKPLRLVFGTGAAGSSRRIYNNGDGDVFSTGVPIGNNGQVNGVRIDYPIVTRSVAGRSAGRAFNMHGAFHWEIKNPHIANHAVGMYMDASPYPSGQCSHNKVWGGIITNCGIGVHNTGYANINEWHGLNISNCDIHIDHTSGLNPYFSGLKCENLSLVPTPLIYARSQGLEIHGLHVEAKNSVGALTIEGASRGTLIDGDIYVDGGTKMSIANGARYSIRLKNGLLMEHQANRSQCVSQVRLPDVTSTGTYTVFSAPITCNVKGFSIVANGFVNYTASDYWTVRFEEWNGNVKVADIGTYTQGGTIGLGRVYVTGLDYALVQDRTVRAVITKTGAAPTFWSPIIITEYDNIH